jgi:hypothetical protein
MTFIRTEKFQKYGILEVLYSETQVKRIYEEYNIQRHDLVLQGKSYDIYAIMDDSYKILDYVAVIRN